MFAAGDPPPDLGPYLDQLQLQQVVCADGGLAHCLAAGLSPHCLIGDFDSVDADMLDWPEVADAKRLTHPADKDASDLELCLEYLAASASDQQQVMVLGASGGRSDHHLFNWLLPALRDWPFQLRLLDHAVDAWLVTPSQALSFPCRTGATVSLVPLGEVAGVSTQGLQYALSDFTLLPGSTRGLSNESLADHVKISVTRGSLLAMHVHARTTLD